MLRPLGGLVRRLCQPPWGPGYPGPHRPLWALLVTTSSGQIEPYYNHCSVAAGTSQRCSPRQRSLLFVAGESQQSKPTAERAEWGLGELVNWFEPFEDETNLDLRPVKSSLTGEEILHLVIAYLADPASPCSAPRRVGNQCDVGAGEAPIKELVQAVMEAGAKVRDGVVRQMIRHATLGFTPNHWPWHPLRGRTWQPNNSGAPWIIVRLATPEELADEKIEQDDYRAMVAAIERDPDPPHDPDAISFSGWVG